MKVANSELISRQSTGISVESPFDSASLISRLYFFWVKFYLKDPEYKAEVPKFINEDVYYNLLKTEWEAEAQTKKPDFFWALTKAYWKRMLKSSSGFAIDMVLQILVGIFAGLFIFVAVEIWLLNQAKGP